MSSAETLYSVRVAFPDYLERGRTQTVSLPLYRDGSLAAPTSGTFSLYDQGTETIVTGSVTIASSVATYSISDTDLGSTLSLGHGYREEWELICADGVTRTYRRDAALVLHAAYPVVTDQDIESVYTDLSRHRGSTVTTWQGYVTEGWKRILGRLEGQGIFPEHIVSSWSLREVHLELVLHLVMLDFSKAQGGRWMELAQAHKREFELAWKRLRFVKATGDDGVADSDDLFAASKGVVYMNQPPTTSWGGGWGI